MAISDPRPLILDSSVWVAYFCREDSQHEKAFRVFVSFRDAELFVPEYVLLEVAAALIRRKHRKLAQEFVEEVVTSNGRLFLPAESLAHETARLFCARNDQLSFADTALLILSREYRVITFDAALARAMR